jgi:hypothetical protein
LLLFIGAAEAAPFQSNYRSNLPAGVGAHFAFLPTLAMAIH